MVMAVMMDAPEDAAFIFTDGSRQPNPGTRGAGAVLYPPHNDSPSLKACKQAMIHPFGKTCGQQEGGVL